MSTVEPLCIDPTEQADLLLLDLHTDVHGLSKREADRRLVRYGRNELVRRGGRRVVPFPFIVWGADEIRRWRRRRRG